MGLFPRSGRICTEMPVSLMELLRRGAPREPQREGAGLRTPFMNPWMTPGNPMGYTGSFGAGVHPQPAPPPAGWTPAMEAEFRSWMNNRAAESGVSGNADSPMHQYNYRRLFQSGQGLSPDESDGGRLHGSSQFKLDGHPNRFVVDNGQIIDSRSGEVISAQGLASLLQGNRKLY